MCDENPSCPVVPGRQVFEVTIDPSILFSGFFRVFHSNQVILAFKMFISLVLVSIQASSLSDKSSFIQLITSIYLTAQTFYSKPKWKSLDFMQINVTRMTTTKFPVAQYQKCQYK